MRIRLIDEHESLFTTLNLPNCGNRQDIEGN